MYLRCWYDNQGLDFQYLVGCFTDHPWSEFHGAAFRWMGLHEGEQGLSIAHWNGFGYIITDSHNLFRIENTV